MGLLFSHVSTPQLRRCQLLRPLSPKTVRNIGAVAKFRGASGHQRPLSDSTTGDGFLPQRLGDWMMRGNAPSSGNKPNNGKMYDALPLISTGGIWMDF